MILNLVFKFLLFHILMLNTWFKLYNFFRRSIIVRVVLDCCFYTEDYFDGDVILFNSSLTGVNCL